jgi:hypothetical protein
MPSGANMTVKKNDGTTDVTFSFIEPSSGGSPAVWQNTAVGVAASHRPELRLSAREASNGTKRTVRATFGYPQIATNSTTSLTTTVFKALGTAEWTFPKDMAAADVNEFVSQFANLLDHADILACVKAGASAT